MKVLLAIALGLSVATMADRAAAQVANPLTQPAAHATMPARPITPNRTQTQPVTRPAVVPRAPEWPPDVPAPTVTLKPGEAPAIKLAETTHDFGRIKAGTDAEHDFTFENTGNAPLEILLARPG